MHSTSFDHLAKNGNLRKFIIREGFLSILFVMLLIMQNTYQTYFSRITNEAVANFETPPDLWAATLINGLFYILMALVILNMLLVLNNLVKAYRKAESGYEDPDEDTLLGEITNHK